MRLVCTPLSLQKIKAVFTQTTAAREFFEELKLRTDIFDLRAEAFIVHYFCKDTSHAKNLAYDFERRWINRNTAVVAELLLEPETDSSFDALYLKQVSPDDGPLPEEEEPVFTSGVIESLRIFEKINTENDAPVDLPAVAKNIVLE